MAEAQATDGGRITITKHRVDYSEIDQQGVAYHARYLVWLDVARTEHLRAVAMSYRDLEASGCRLMVSGLNVRYRRSARYDDPVRVRCWIRSVETRRITFGYAVEHDETDALLATATVELLVLDAAQKLSRFPDELQGRLLPVPDPVRL